jgi:D-alanine--poly(phosphoribitol) ligase subunit 1
MFRDSAVSSLPARDTTSILDLLLASRQAGESRPALWVDGCTLTYAELCDAAARLAGVIETTRANHSPHRQHQCGLLVNRTPMAYAGVLASLMAGSAYVPLNPHFPRDRLLSILFSSAIETLIVDERSAAMARSLLEACPRPMTVLLPYGITRKDMARSPLHTYIAWADIERAAPAALDTQLPADSGAYLLFTSGSTGAPKGVLISHANVLTYITNAIARYRPGADDRFSQLFDFSFDLSAHDMFVAWAAGACLYCAPEASVAGLGDFIRRCQLTFWLSVPATAAFMRQLHMLKPGRYPSLRWSLFCGEALPTGLARVWQDAAPNSTVENLYGPTEATIAFTVYRLPQEPDPELDALPTVPIGKPLPGHKIVVVDEAGSPVPNGDPGELCLGGAQVAAGYWDAPDQTAAKFQPPKCADAPGTRWYRTGDRAIISSKYGLLFLGRIDRQTKICGHRVELLEVEAALRAAARTDTVAAIPWPLDEGGLARGLVGFVARSTSSPLEIIERCRNILPNYMLPSIVYRIEKWPLNSNGKTDYKSLTARLEQDVELQ